MGTVFSVQLFILHHMPLLGGGLGLFGCQIVSMVVSTGLFLWALPQHVLLELRFGALVKNSLLLFFRFFGKTMQASLLFLLYMLLVWAIFPASVFLLLVAGLWLPLLCAFQIIYPTLDNVFHIEESLQEKTRFTGNEE